VLDVVGLDLPDPVVAEHGQDPVPHHGGVQLRGALADLVLAEP
jgi:hypothetical protein